MQRKSDFRIRKTGRSENSLSQRWSVVRDFKDYLFTMRLLQVFLLIGFAWNINLTAFAQNRDWPMFGGTPNRNMVNVTKTGVPTHWDLGKKTNIKWVAELGTQTFSTPVIAGGKIFIGTNNQNSRDPKVKGSKGILMCFEEATGKFLWQAVHEMIINPRLSDWPYCGITSTPTVEGKRIYYVSSACELVCADTEGFLDGRNVGLQTEALKSKKDADIVWRLDMREKLGVRHHCTSSSCPLIIGDLLFVVTGNGVDSGHIDIPAPLAPSFLVVNKETGKVVWQSNFPTQALLDIPAKLIRDQRWDRIKNLVDAGKCLMHGQWSSPVYAKTSGIPQVIFPGGDGWLYAFTPQTGKLLWKFDCNPKGAFYVLGSKATRNDFVATPVVYKDQLYIGVGQDPEHQEGVGHLWCLDLRRAVRFGPTNPERDVSPRDNNFDPNAEVNAKSALGWHYGGFTPGGERKRPYQYYFGRTLSTCAVHDGLVYACDLGGIVYCFDAENGKLHWSWKTNAPIWASPYWVDGKIYIGDQKGRVHIFQHGKNKRKPITISMPKQRISSTIVAANGTLYVTTRNRLIAVKKGIDRCNSFVK